MTFKFPEKYRLRKGEFGSDPAIHGNNGAGFIPRRPGQPPLKFIASDGEQWASVKGYEGLYEVSTLGKVRAREKTVPLPNGAERHHPQAELSQDKGGRYPRISLCRDGEIKKVLLHVLVAETFISKPEHFTEVNHRDGNKENSHVSNLEWCTHQYNVRHAIDSGLSQGWRTAEIEKIKDMLDSGMSVARVAEELECPRQAISYVKNGRHRSLAPEPPSRWNGTPHWEHVSVSLPHRCPTWDEICLVKGLFWDDEDAVMQLHPPRSTWVNNHPNCLHLWRPVGMAIPLPPEFMVGVRELGVLA